MAASQPTLIGPLTGVLDLRSTPDELPKGAVRMRQNFRTIGNGVIRTGSGFEKLLSTSDYNNSDFHDQMLSVSGSIRQPITLLLEAESTRKIRSLIVGTQSTIAQLNSHSGAYRILGSGYGGTASTSASAPRFKADYLGDYVLFTNDYDKVKYMILEAAADDSGNFIYDLPDLDIIALRRAKVVFQWHNVMFLANVEMDSERVAYRLIWSDFDKPISFDPANLDSIAGSKDLYPYEEILAAAAFGNSFLIYTTHGIWEMIAVGGDQSFDFRRVYDGEKDRLKAVIAFPNTLISVHDGHAYIGNDGIYYFSQYSPAPDRLEWLHLSTKDLMEDIDRNACQVHIGQIFGDEAYFSVAKVGSSNQCPNYTLRANKTYKVADVVDAGFTAFCQFSAQNIPTIRDFIIENEICDLAGLTAAGYPYGKEGLPRTALSSGAAFQPMEFYTTVTQDVGPPGVIMVEDWNQPTASADSLCALLGGEKLDEICRVCEVAPVLVGAYSVDWCLKQLTDTVFYRERCANPTAVGVTSADGYTASVPSYILDPMTHILRFAPAAIPNSILKMDKLILEYLAQISNAPLSIGLRIGVSGQPADSNIGDGIVWFPHSLKVLQFKTTRNSAQHLAAGTQPTSTLQWNFFREGRYLHIELTIVGVGGDSVFSRIEPVFSNLGAALNY